MEEDIVVSESEEHVVQFFLGSSPDIALFNFYLAEDILSVDCKMMPLFGLNPGGEELCASSEIHLCVNDRLEVKVGVSAEGKYRFHELMGVVYEDEEVDITHSGYIFTLGEATIDGDL